MIEISDESMTLVVDGEIVASARFSQHAAADGNGAWIVSTHPARLFTRNGAITALTLVERLAAGYGRQRPVREVLTSGTVPITDQPEYRSTCVLSSRRPLSIMCYDEICHCLELLAGRS
jgi:hypothetical protein